jgi:ABC-type nitrate/sulfonate/bicarbonate transport system permease component
MSTAAAQRPRARINSARNSALVWGGCSLGALLIVWFVVTSGTGLVAPRLLPSPAVLAERIFVLATTPFGGHDLFGHAVASLERWTFGVLAAIALGLPLGVLFAWLPPVRAALTPAFELLRYIPPFAWVPIAILWFGASTLTQALVVFVAAFPACVINTQLGVSQVDKVLVQASRTLGAGSWMTLRKVVLPVAAHDAFAGIRIAVSNGWMALVGAELVVGKVGLGFLVSQGQANDSVATVFVGIIAIGLLGVLIDSGVRWLQRAALPWRTADASRA